MIKFRTEALFKSTESIWNHLLSIIFPPICLSCEKSSYGEQRFQICDDCWQSIRVIKRPYCFICGYPIHCGEKELVPDQFICGNCRLHKKWFTVASSACYYLDEIKNLIHRFKFDGYTGLSYALSFLLLQKYLYDSRLGGEDIIIPVPLHRQRYRQRGFNQSELLTIHMSRYTSIPVNSRIILRIKNTEPQYEMNEEERAINLKNAFKVINKEEISNKKALLIDDIYTTGATAYEVSKTLIKAGASSVNVLTVARSLPIS